MDRLTDNPNWHVKVFDDTIAEKWIEDALKFPVDEIYDEISDCNYNNRHPKKLKTILDRGCLEYVSAVWLSLSWIILNMLLVYPRTTCQSQVL
jgi:hypothetical protein